MQIQTHIFWIQDPLYNQTKINWIAFNGWWTGQTHTDTAYTELHVIVIASCDKANYQSSVLLFKTGVTY